MAAPPAALFAEASRLHAKGQLAEAARLLHTLLAAAPEHAGALNLLGIALAQGGDPIAGAAQVGRAVALAPEDPIYLRNLCELHRQSGHPVAAVEAGTRALAIAPGDTVARLNLAMAQFDALDLPASLASTEALLAAEPENASAHFLLAQLRLIQGDFAPGWQSYAWRWQIPGAAQPRPASPTPEWDGAPLPGHLLLIADQGFGDMIQFARYLPWAAARCGRLSIACPKSLRGLFQPLAPNADVIDDLATTREHPPDAFAAFSSLAGLAADIPGADGYLHPEAGAKAGWSARLAQLAPGPQRRIGIVWAGSPAHRADRQRSMALASLAPMLATPRTIFISLQKGRAMKQIGDWFGPAPILNLGAEIADYGDTAAILACLDALVAVDTSVAHLAGAMGMPVHILLPHRPDWRWMLGRDDTPWYGSGRLWRDPAPGDRAGAVQALAQAL